MTKQCTLCKRELTLDNFNKKQRSEDGLQNVCRECNRSKSRMYYANNRDKHLKTIYINRKKYVARAKALVKKAKSKGCICCGETEHRCLDFHHLDPKSKDFNLSLVANGTITSIKRIQCEIDKCAIVCANCHRKIHAGLLCLLRSGGYRI